MCYGCCGGGGGGALVAMNELRSPGVQVPPYRYVRPWRRGQEFGHGDFGGPLAGPSGSPGTPGDKLAELLQLASPEDHERILRAAAMLSPESPTRSLNTPKRVARSQSVLLSGASLELPVPPIFRHLLS